VGCDHGLVCEFVAKNRLASTVLACDISEKCLEKARALLKDYDGVEFFVADGLSGVKKTEVAVICGMGALTIINILSAIDYKPYLILGAQKYVESLRYWLGRNGYAIEKDFVVEEDGIFYDIICAKEGSCEIDEISANEGVFYKQKDEMRRKKYEFEVEKYSSLFPSSKNIRLLEMAKEALRWQNL
jgi:tRNA (adenine22-N1)-methyltransferase